MSFELSIELSITNKIWNGTAYNQLDEYLKNRL